MNHPVDTYAHYEAAKLNATRFVTLGEYQRLRDLARAVVDAHESRGTTLDRAIEELGAEAARPTI